MICCKGVAVRCERWCGRWYGDLMWWYGGVICFNLALV